MAFVKTMKAEKVEPVSREGNRKIRAFVREAGVQSVSQLTDEQRRELEKR